MGKKKLKINDIEVIRLGHNDYITSKEKSGKKADFSNAIIEEYNFKDFADLSGVNFENSELNRVQFNSMYAVGCNFKNAEFWQASFQHTKLDEANFSNSKFHNGCNFSGASLRDAIFEKVQINSSRGNAMFQNNNAKNINFHKADLQNVFFGNNCIFKDSNFSESNCSGARFDTSSLEGSNFSNANLSNASLRECSLDGANFEEANLDNAIFTDAIHADKVKKGKKEVINTKVASTTTELSKIFVNKGNKIITEQKKSERIYVALIAIIFTVSLTFIWLSWHYILRAIENNEVLSEDIFLFLPFLIASLLFILAPLIWLAKYYGNKNKIYLGLKEFYDHKIILIEAIMGFKEATEGSSDIIIQGFDRLTKKDPSDIISPSAKTEQYPLPVLQIIEKTLELAKENIRKPTQKK